MIGFFLAKETYLSNKRDLSIYTITDEGNRVVRLSWFEMRWCNASLSREMLFFRVMKCCCVVKKKNYALRMVVCTKCYALLFHDVLGMCTT